MATYTPKTGLEILRWNRAAANALNQGARNSAAAGIAFTNPLPEGSIADSMRTSQSIIPGLVSWWETFLGLLSKLTTQGKVILAFGIIAFIVIIKE